MFEYSKCDCEKESGPRVGIDRSDDAFTKSTIESNNFLLQNNLKAKTRLRIA